MRMLALILATAMTTVAIAQEKKSSQSEESVKKIKDLQKERIAVLKDLVEQTTIQYKSALSSFEEVWDAKILLLKAELEGAEKESERIAIYKETIDTLKQYEERARAQVESGRGTNAVVLKIKAKRLEIEILLEQAKMKEAKEKK